MSIVNRIITAKDYCKKDKVDSIKERIRKIGREVARKTGEPLLIQFSKMSQRPVYARIELGQWVADCECRGCEFVDPDEPIFFCFSCANIIDTGMLRPVVFPPSEERKEIERIVLERPVDDIRGRNDLERAHQASAVIYIDMPDGHSLPLTRSWNAGEPIKHLLEENEAVEKWRKASLKQKNNGAKLEDE